MNNIVENYSYLPITINDHSDFSFLLRSLLDFNIDYCGFPDKELSKIDIYEAQFNGIPTGLHVAGFLANIAMLEVDKRLHDYVVASSKTNERIAIFRFVDDYTVLAENFDSLLSTISKIKILISEMGQNGGNDSQLGINYSKIKPIELQNYLFLKYNDVITKTDCRDINAVKDAFCKQIIDIYNHNTKLIELCSLCAASEDLLCKSLFKMFSDKEKLGSPLEFKHFDNSLKIKAINACKLNIEFPTPLMNQTLKKISHINSIPFDLLDSLEEDQVTTDLEHLLISDIPDEEIRKETRISFASNRLAQFVPKIKPDYKLAYLNEHNKLRKMSLIEERDKLKGSYKGNDIDKILADYKNKIEGINTDIFQKQNEIKKELALNVDKKQAVFRLLLKSINDCPDKISLWNNAILYCERVGYKKTWEIVQLINKLEYSETINTYTALYIIAHICNTLVQSLHRISKLDIDSLTDEKKSILVNFLTGIYSKKFLSKIFTKKHFKSSAIYYVDQSLKLFRITLGLFLYENKIKFSHSKTLCALDIDGWYDKPREYIESMGFTFETLIWWWEFSIYNNKNNLPSKYFLEYLNHSPNLNNPATISTLSLYPRFITVAPLESILNQEFDKSFSFYWWNELYTFSNDSDIQNKIHHAFSNHRLGILREYQNIKQSDFISIFDFISSKNNNELSALKILNILTKHIIQMRDIKINDTIDFDNINHISDDKYDKFISNFPHNILLNITENTENILEHNIEILEFCKDSFNDQRYKPYFIDWRNSEASKNQILLFGLGILFFAIIK